MSIVTSTGVVSTYKSIAEMLSDLEAEREG